MNGILKQAMVSVGVSIIAAAAQTAVSELVREYFQQLKDKKEKDGDSKKDS